jgi:hypothetical protein
LTLRSKHVKVALKKVRFPNLPRCKAFHNGRLCNSIAQFRIFGLAICNQQDCIDYAMKQHLSEYDTLKREAKA